MRSPLITTRTLDLEGANKMTIISFITSLLLLLILSILLSSLIDALIPFDTVKRIFYYPGIVIHEAAHAAASRLLGVPIYEINFHEGYVQIESDIDPIKRLIIGVSPVFFAWIIGGTLLLAAFSLLTAGSWTFGVLLFLIGLSVFVSAAPSLTDLNILLHNKRESVTGVILILSCGIIGYFLMLEQFQNNTLAFGGAMVTAILGYFIWRARSADDGRWYL